MAKPPGEDPAVLHGKVQVRVLSMLASGEDDVFELMSALAAYDVGHHFTPDVALLEVAATALGLAVPLVLHPHSLARRCQGDLQRGAGIGRGLVPAAADLAPPAGGVVDVVHEEPRPVPLGAVPAPARAVEYRWA